MKVRYNIYKSQTKYMEIIIIFSHSQMEIFRLYGKGQKYSNSSYEILVDNVKYNLDRNKYYDDSSIKFKFN